MRIASDSDAIWAAKQRGGRLEWDLENNDSYTHIPDGLSQRICQGENTNQREEKKKEKSALPLLCKR
jgi:hypothetical protein